MLAETRAELDDFVHSSKELEEELLRELERNEKVQKDLKDKVIAVEADRDNWKVHSPIFLIRRDGLTSRVVGNSPALCLYKRTTIRP